MRRDYIQQKGYQIVEMWECEWWSLYKIDASVKRHLRKNFPYRRPLSEERPLQTIIDGRFFGFVESDIEVPEHLRDNFSNFPPIFKNTAVSRDDIGNLMKQYAKKENIMVQPRRMLISSFFLTNGTNKTPLLLFFFATWASLLKDSPVFSIHSQNMFRHLRTVCRGCTTTRRLKSN